MSTPHYEVVIIGSGAGGGTLFWKLALAGKKVALLERGGYVPREQDNWSAKAVNVQAKYNTKETWRDSDGKPLHPHTNYFVGGNTKFYGAALFRLRREDFGEVRHHGGISPAWPVGYDEMEPYYLQAEHLYEVRGERGADPSEPAASGPYKFPRVPHEPRIQRLHDDLAKLGVRPFHVPLGVRMDPGDPRSKCIRCSTCDGFPCLVWAKSDAQTICVDPALDRPNATLVTGALVQRLETDATGQTVTKVHVLRNGVPETYSGDLVVVSAGAINSAALLLRSASDKHPNGLANGSDVVGRHYMGHLNSVVLAISPEANPTVFQKTLAINDWYHASKDWEFPMGHISFVGKMDAVTLSAGAPKIVPGMTLEIMAKHSLDFWLTSEDLPDPNNRVTLDRDGSVVLTYAPNNEEGHKRLQSTLKGLLRKIDGMEHFVPRELFVGQRIPLAGVAHQNGTVRFGDDPKTSALDRDCKSWEVDNLYVVDGGFFPSSAAVNPALTIMANALRVGDRMLERLG